MEVTMFPMGFGEAILLYREDSCLLVDCGSESPLKDNYFQAVHQELTHFKTKTLLLSHFHEDHINGISYLTKNSRNVFHTIYVPNIFTKGDRNLDLIIIEQLLNEILTRTKSSSRIWNFLYDLYKRNNHIQLLQKDDVFSEIGYDFLVLWPKPKDVNQNSVFAKFSEERAWALLFENHTSDLLEEIQKFARQITHPEAKLGDFLQLDELVKKIDVRFNNLKKKYKRFCKVQSISEDEIKSLKKQIRNNNASIVFRTERGTKEILVTGDVPCLILKKIVEDETKTFKEYKKHYNLIKAPHHGTSSEYIDFAKYYDFDKLLISNGETYMSEKSRGEIASKYLENVDLYQVFCTNTIQNRCQYLLKNNKSAPCCVNCRVEDLPIRCTTKRNIPEIIFQFADENKFKAELFKTRQAKIIWEYNDGTRDETIWRANDIKMSSNIKQNIQSKTIWRAKEKNGLIRVCVEIIKENAYR